MSACQPLSLVLRCRRVLLAGLLLGARAPLAAQDAPRPTLAVLVLQGAYTPPGAKGGAQAGQDPRFPRRFANGGGQTPGRSRPLGELLTQRIDMNFLKTGRFQLIERTQMNAVLKEGALEQKGLVDDATAVTLGRQLGATFVLVGSYNGNMVRGIDIQEHVFAKDTREEFFQGKLEVRLRVVRTEDGTIQEPMILNASARAPQQGKAFEALMEDFSNVLGRELSVRYPVTGYVVKLLSDKEVLTDLGRSRGVEPGELFLALETGPDAVHPVTGKRVPGERKVVAELVVADAGQESSTLRLTSGKVRLKPGTLLERKPR